MGVGRRALAPVLVVVLGAAVLVPPAEARKIAWIRQDGSAAWDQLNGVAATRSAVFAVGKTEGTLPGQVSPPGGTDAVLRRYGTDGSIRWTSQFGTTVVDDALDVSVQGPAVYVGGSTDGTFPGATGPSAGGRDAFLRRYDGAGEIRWTRQFGTAGADYASGVAASPSGVVVAGQTTGAFPGETSAGMTDAFVRMYDADGTVQWRDQFGSSASDGAFGVAIDETGVYVAGHAAGALPGQTARGDFDIFVRKYDLAGNERWTRQFGTNGSDSGFDISVGAAGVFVAGRAAGKLPGGVTFGGYDGFVRRYRRSGTAVWTRQVGTSGDDSATSVLAARAGVFVGGQAGGTFSGQASAGEADAFVRKLTADGEVAWTRQYGTAGFDSASGLAAVPAGVFAATAAGGAFEGQTSAGSVDFALVRFVSYRPDASIRRSAESRFVGDDVYNLTGANQTRGWKASRGGSRTFVVRAENDGDAVDRIAVKGCRRADGMRVRYLGSDSKDVTDAVVAGSHSLGAIDPARSAALRVVLTVRESAAVGTTGACRVRLSSGRSSRADVVVAEVTVTR